MILLLVPVAGALVGLALWVALRQVGLLGLPPGDTAGTTGGTGGERGYGYGGGGSDRGSGVRGFLDSLPAGLLVGVIVVSAIWITMWLVALFVGMGILS